MYDIIIVGAGPAGLTAALYARRANKTVLLLEKGAFGGQITFSPKVENYPGFGSVSGSELADKLVEQVLEPGSFDGVQGVIQGHPAKPDPYLANRLTAALGVKPEECALVGDSDIDILTAKNAGMLHIGVTWGYKSAEVLREKGATLLANSVEELEALLRERIGG